MGKPNNSVWTRIAHAGQERVSEGIHSWEGGGAGCVSPSCSDALMPAFGASLVSAGSF